MYTLHCRHCGKEFQSQRKGRAFCSLSCSSKWNYANKSYVKSNLTGRHKSTMRVWQKNKLFIQLTGKFPYSQTTGQINTKFVRKYLIQKYGNKCWICGTSSWNDKPVPLVCDHVDGNHANYKVQNYRLICPNCDAQLPTYKSKNKHKHKAA